MRSEKERKARLFLDECEKRYTESVKACALTVSKTANIRYIALSGPTCSGKTTTAEILINELNSYGFEAVVVSIDHFFRNRADLISEAKRNGTPLDMDSVKAIDLDALTEFLAGIDEGREVFLPYYDFTLGEQSGGETVIPKKNSLYIFEGIQAFYPEVVSLFKGECLLRVFISPMRSLDCGGVILSGREQRLLRRILRDSKFRGTGALSTFNHWSEVVKNEQINIDPYKDTADFVIDSTMPYELSVMKNELSVLLEALPEVEDKKKLRAALDCFESISKDLVPSDSVIREFIG